MWEAIRENRRRSTLLIGLMGSILVGLGAVIGGAVGGGAETAAFGAIAALAVWGVMLAVSLGGGEQVVLRAARARQIEKEDHPRLWNVVEEMTIASGLGTPPRVYLVDDDSPNAFATGRDAKTGCVAVTTGLLRRLNRDELQGVVAHEIAHIKNLDIRFMTIAAVMVGSVTILSDVFLRYLWFGGGRRRGRGSGSGGGQAQLLMTAVAIVAAVLAPIATQLLYFACSRQREYLADASAARFTRYPAGLASALEKIAGSVVSKRGTQRVLAPMFVVNPLQAVGRVGLFSTHPPTEKRVAILRAMGGNAGWADYEAAFGKIEGGRCLSSRLTGSEGSVPAREPSAEPEPRQATEQRARDATDLLDRLVGFLLVPCACGVRIKVPDDFRHRQLVCPRCKRKHSVPEVHDADAGPLRYERRGTGWESFRCSCGKTIQLSPGFRLDRTRCAGCGREIHVA